LLLLLLLMLLLMLLRDGCGKEATMQSTYSGRKLAAWAWPGFSLEVQVLPPKNLTTFLVAALKN